MLFIYILWTQFSQQYFKLNIQLDALPFEENADKRQTSFALFFENYATSISVIENYTECLFKALEKSHSKLRICKFVFSVHEWLWQAEIELNSCSYTEKPLRVNANKSFAKWSSNSYS